MIQDTMSDAMKHNTCAYELYNMEYDNVWREKEKVWSDTLLYV